MFLDLVIYLGDEFWKSFQMRAHFLRNFPDTQYLTPTIVLHSAECMLSNVQDLNTCGTVLPCPWGAGSLNGIETVVHVQAKALFWVLKRPLWFVLPRAAQFHFGPKLSRVARYICPALSVSAGLKNSACWALTLSSQWLSCHFSQWHCQAVVFSALGKQIHKEQIIACFNLIDNFWLVLQPTNKHSSSTLREI